MGSPPLLNVLVQPRAFARLLLGSLAVALLLLVDGYVLILASRLVGIYLLLAILGSTGIAGICAVLVAHKYELRLLRARVTQGSYPLNELRRIITLLIVAFLFVLPGFATDAIALLMLWRPIGWLVGAAGEKAFRDGFRTLYEYMRLLD